MTKPDFFIIGAPKCGTTSLARYLAEHPRVFFSDPKEPHFFNTDMTFRFCRSEAEYLKLFEQAGQEHLARGEGSIFYLYSRDAVPNILKFNPAAKFVVMLRRPLDVVIALHSEWLNGHFDTVRDLGLAWRLQTARRSGHLVPSTCIDPRILLYSEIAALGTQLERLYAQVPRRKVKVILLDDLRSGPLSVYRDVLDFLGVPYQGREEFPVYNQRKRVRSVVLYRLLNRMIRLRRKLPVRRQFGVLTKINDANLSHAVAAEVPADVRVEISEHLKGEVETLGSLLDRDLSDWRAQA